MNFAIGFGLFLLGALAVLIVWGVASWLSAMDPNAEEAETADDFPDVSTRGHAALSAGESADIARQMRESFGPLTGEELEDREDVQRLIQNISGP